MGKPTMMNCRLNGLRRISDVRTQGKITDLNYRAYAAFNEREENDLGVVRIHFLTSTRDVPVRVQWKDQAANRFECDVRDRD